MQTIHNLSLNKILDEDFLQSLAKSADLYKIGSNSVLDPEEIRIGLKVVPRFVMSLLISALTPMPLNTSIELQLPFGKNARVSANKNAADDYTGSVYDNNKLVYSFQNRSIPGLGIILLSTFELYELEKLEKETIEPTEHAEAKIQKLIDARMELHSLVSRVVENKISERDALNKLMMDRLNEALAKEHKKNEQISDVTKIAHQSAQSGEYFQGMANGMEVADSIANNKEPNFAEAPKKKLYFKAEDMAKKEESPEKGSPLKAFLERKKKPKEHRIEIAKSETINCPDCGQTIFGQGSFSCCLCYGQDQYSKIWIKKSEESIQIRFSRGWDKENIQMLLDTLRKTNGKD